MRYVDIAIIGGGSAGLAAAIAAYENGTKDILILEREETLGGILKQCIHNGFGLHTFKEELTGPEYAKRYIDKVLEYGIPYQCDTMVLEITEDKIVTAVSRANGLQQIKAKSVVLAMGCRERPRGSLAIPGFRGSGVYTAGTAQKFVNLEGLMPGKKVVILGSGDIGLIMARRMTFMGAKVLACVELMPFSSGLKRNIVQCLDDYDIPLLLNHTVTDIHGKQRLTGVTVAEVDKKTKKPIEGTEVEYECDTLLLSVGLIPENELSKTANVELCSETAGPYVDERLETSVKGIFACGNVLHVHDLVDYVSKESLEAGKNAALYVQGKGKSSDITLEVVNGEGVMGAVPEYIHPDIIDEPVTVMLRPREVFENATIFVDINGEQVYKKKSRILAPGEMVNLKLKPELFSGVGGGKLTLGVEV